MFKKQQRQRQINVLAFKIYHW